MRKSYPHTYFFLIYKTPISSCKTKYHTRLTDLQYINNEPSIENINKIRNERITKSIKANKITVKNKNKESIKLKNSIGIGKNMNADGCKSNSWQLGGKDIYKRKRFIF